MEETYCTSAIVLTSQIFRECDGKKIVYSLARGKLDLVARGVKKIKSKLASHLEPISLTKIMVVRGRQFDYIGGAVSENCYPSIKADLAGLQTVGRAINAFNQLVKLAVADEKIFFLLEDFLNFLNKEIASRPREDYQIWASFFILKLLVLLGYEPELYDCLNCREKILPGGNFFVIDRGGLMCGRCFSGKTRQIISPFACPAYAGIKPACPVGRGDGGISDNCIKVLREAISQSFANLKKLKMGPALAAETGNVINSFFQYCL